MIQIFGTKKCNETKKAERFFKERGIKFQFIDMKEKGMSKGEFTSDAQAVGGNEKLINENCKDKDTLGIITSGYLKPEEALRLLMIGPEYTQVAIKTEKAAERLKWISFEEIKKVDDKTLRAEQKEYQERFAEEMAKISGD